MHPIVLLSACGQHFFPFGDVTDDGPITERKPVTAEPLFLLGPIGPFAWRIGPLTDLCPSSLCLALRISELIKIVKTLVISGGRRWAGHESSPVRRHGFFLVTVNQDPETGRLIWTPRPPFLSLLD